MTTTNLQKVAIFAVVAFATAVFMLSAHYLSIFQLYYNQPSLLIGTTYSSPVALVESTPNQLSKPSSSATHPTSSSCRDDVCRMVKEKEFQRLYEYAKWALSRPPSVTCKDRRKLGKDVGPMDQEPYSLCFDPPFALIPGNCLVYSFGIANEWDFDDQVASQFQCEVYSFDPSMNLEDNYTRQSGRVKFYKIGLWSEDMIYVPNGSEHYPNQNPGNWTMRTLRSVAKQFGHENRMIDILKVDVEGAETRGFLSALEDGFIQNHVGTLTLEWHLWNQIVDDVPELVKILEIHEKLVEAGFELFHSAPRTVAAGYFPLESYVNKDYYFKMRSPASSVYQSTSTTASSSHSKNSIE